ncbi:MAG: hypothetical protein KAJ79_00135 [Candidatus Omnitrophica bacterium]|nr:hypothetical protein [Candidatus Omnitrophota bacterium]
MKLGRRSFLFAFILFFSLLAFHAIVSINAKEDKDVQWEFIKLYKEWLKLNDETFRMMSFKISSCQLLKRGCTPKITLDDNLGRKWIFKMTHMDDARPLDHYTEQETAVLLYRIYKFFGIETPRIHLTTISINKKKIFGSIQRFIPNKGTLIEYSPSQISSHGFDYILKKHVIDSLFSLCGLRARHFLISSLDESSKVKNLIHTDNEFYFENPNSCSLTHGWFEPRAKIYHTDYYHEIWEAYTTGKINLDFEKNFVFINYVSGFPDNVFEEMFFSTKMFDSKESSRFGYMENIVKRFLHFLFTRKNTLNNDFLKFYKSLAEKRNSSLEFYEDKNSRGIIATLSRNFIKEIKYLKKEKSKLKEAPIYSSNIDAMFSLEGFFFLREAGNAYLKKKESLASVGLNLLENLSSLKAVAVNEYEKKTLEFYIKEAEEVCSSAEVSTNFIEMHKIANFLVPET